MSGACDQRSIIKKWGVMMMLPARIANIAALVIFSLLAGCTTTPEPPKSDWAAASSAGFPLVFDAALAGGEMSRVFRDAVHRRSVHSTSGARKYRIALAEEGHRLYYTYSRTNPDYAIESFDLQHAVTKGLEGAPFKVHAEGRAPVGPAPGRFINWSARGVTCVYAVSSVGDVHGTLRQQFSGKNMLEAVYCVPGDYAINAAVVTEIGQAIMVVEE